MIFKKATTPWWTSVVAGPAFASMFIGSLYIGNKKFSPNNPNAQYKFASYVNTPNQQYTLHEEQVEEPEEYEDLFSQTYEAAGWY
jgi:hypothetical protein